MKKLLTVSLVAIMAVSAANAEIASVEYIKGDNVLGVGESTLSATLNTTDKTVSGAINELKTSIDGMTGDSGTVATQVADALTEAKSYTDAGVKELADGAVKTNADAIAGMDLTEVGGANKYIATVSQADGKVVATAGTIDTEVTANSNNLITSGAVATKVSSITTGLGDLTADLEDSKTAIAELQSGKADKATTLSGYGITDAMTSTAITTAISTAKTEAIEASDTKGAAAQALTDAKAFTQEQISNLGKLATIDTACATGVTDCALVIRNGNIQWEKVSY